MTERERKQQLEIRRLIEIARRAHGLAGDYLDKAENLALRLSTKRQRKVKP